MLRVRDLRKTYRVPVKAAGLYASLRSLWNRETRDVRAVDGISFDIAPGERIGFLGPNGAGKTTTLKMLTGLLAPTSGSCEVSGFTPGNRDPDFLKLVTLVMGQKQQLLWDLPPTETFELNRALFDVPGPQYKETLHELCELLQLDEVLHRPVRNLSLGQRMRCELTASLLHRPKVLFLDEPTIGLDVEVQEMVRQFVAAYNARHGATVVLTSHDMQDVAALADRIILIDTGRIAFDGSIDELSGLFGGGRRLVVDGEGESLGPLGFEEASPGRWQATVPPQEVNALLTEVIRRLPHANVRVTDPPLDEVMRAAFASRSQDG